MMGRSHVFSGLLAGSAALPFMQFEDPLHAVGFVAVTGAAALIPDLDHHNSTLTNMWGPVTEALHKVLNFVGRGHRAGTHDALLSPAAIALVAFGASLNQWTSFLFLAFMIGFALRAAEFVIPGRTFERGIVSALTAVVASAGLVFLLDERLWWLPVALPLGVLMHILGDAITPQGVPAPLSVFTGRRRTWLSGPLTTNTTVETKVIAPGFLIVACAVFAVGMPGGIGWDTVGNTVGDALVSATAGT